MEKQRNIKLIVLCSLIIAIIGLSVGYAALSASLKITTNGMVTGGKWDIHFENIYVLNTYGKATSDTPKIISSASGKNDEISFSLAMKQPKDVIVYSIDIVNDSTIDATIDSIVTDIHNNNYLEVLSFYEDGKEIKNGDVIAASSREKITIRIKYKDNITASELPTAETSININYLIKYSQSPNTNGSDHVGEVTNQPKYGKVYNYYNMNLTLLKKNEQDNIITGKVIFTNDNINYDIYDYSFDILSGTIDINIGGISNALFINGSFTLNMNGNELVFSDTNTYFKDKYAYKDEPQSTIDDVKFYYGIYYNESKDSYIKIFKYEDGLDDQNPNKSKNFSISLPNNNKLMTTGNIGELLISQNVSIEGKNINFDGNDYALVEF